MASPAEWFEMALSVEGIDADVTEIPNEYTHIVTMYVSKNIGGTRYRFEDKINIFRDDDPQIMRKDIAVAAIRLRDRLKQQFRTTYHWDGHHMEVYFFDTMYASCSTCEHEVSIEEILDTQTTIDAESTTPCPTPMDISQLILDINPKRRALVELYLIGALKQRCDHNS